MVLITTENIQLVQTKQSLLHGLSMLAFGL